MGVSEFKSAFPEASKEEFRKSRRQIRTLKPKAPSPCSDALLGLPLVLKKVLPGEPRLASYPMRLKMEGQ